MAEKYVLNLYCSERQQQLGIPSNTLEFNNRAVAMNRGREMVSSCASYVGFDVQKKY